MQLENCIKKEKGRHFLFEFRAKPTNLPQMISIVANIFHSIAKKCYSDFFVSNFPETNHLTIAFLN